MKFALCGYPLFVVLCSAQQPAVQAPLQHFFINESQTISVHELQQRNQSKAHEKFIDAKLASERGDHPRAIKLFLKTLQVDPLLSDARNDLAVEFVVSGQLDRAAEQLRALMQLDPGFLMAYTNLAIVLCTQKKFPDAESVARRALGLDPNSGKANLLLAIALYAQGKRNAEIQSALEAAGRTNPKANELLKKWFGIADLADTAVHP